LWSLEGKNFRLFLLYGETTRAIQRGAAKEIDRQRIGRGDFGEAATIDLGQVKAIYRLNSIIEL
jgi:hypothetical protein